MNLDYGPIENDPLYSLDEDERYVLETSGGKDYSMIKGYEELSQVMQSAWGISLKEGLDPKDIAPILNHECDSVEDLIRNVEYRLA